MLSPFQVVNFHAAQPAGKGQVSTPGGEFEAGPHVVGTENFQGTIPKGIEGNFPRPLFGKIRVRVADGEEKPLAGPVGDENPHPFRQDLGFVGGQV